MTDSYQALERRIRNRMLATTAWITTTATFTMVNAVEGDTMGITVWAINAVIGMGLFSTLTAQRSAVRQTKIAVEQEALYMKAFKGAAEPEADWYEAAHAAGFFEPIVSEARLEPTFLAIDTEAYLAELEAELMTPEEKAAKIVSSPSVAPSSSSFDERYEAEVKALEKPTRNVESIIATPTASALNDMESYVTTRGTESYSMVGTWEIEPGGHGDQVMIRALSGRRNVMRFSESVSPQMRKRAIIEMLQQMNAEDEGPTDMAGNVIHAHGNVTPIRQARA